MSYIAAESDLVPTYTQTEVDALIAAVLLLAGGTVTGPVVFSNASIKLTGLPTADPHVAGALWNNAGALTVSAG